MSYVSRHQAGSPADADEQFPGSDEPTDRLPIVRPVRIPQQRGSVRMHRTVGGELAALAFATPLPIPAQRRPLLAG